jgi:hypothetical protein
VREVTRDPASVGAKQSRKLNSARILRQLIVDRAHLPLKRQCGYDVQLQPHDLIGPGDEIAIGFPVDEPEQHQNERSEGAEGDGGPAEGACPCNIADAHQIAG